MGFLKNSEQVQDQPLFISTLQEEFVDCSIACEDGIVGAHRVVLAGCSSYLRDLFARVANPHPVIFLLNTSRSLVLMLMEVGLRCLELILKYLAVN